MRYYRYVSVVLLLLLVTACGRQLDDTTVDGQVDTAVEETIAVTEVADEIADEAGTDDPVEVIEVVISLETLVDDTASFGDPSNSRVAAVLEANPIAGEQIFVQRNLPGGAQACSSCHNANEQRLVGPGMQGLPQRADGRVSGESAVEYVYNSIVNPEAHIVDGYPPGVMPQNYGEVLTDEQLSDLTAYLMTLNEDGPIPIQERAEALISAAESASAETTPETVAQGPTQTPFIIIVTATPEGAVAESTEEATESVAAEATEEVVVEAIAEESTEEVVAEATEAPARVVTVQVIITATPPPATDETPEAVTEATEVAQAPTLPPTPAISPTPDRVARLANLGIPSYGEELFAANCADCHSVESADMGEDGPGLLGIPQRAASAASGQSAAGYLYTTLTNPEFHGTNYADELGNAQVYDIIAYMLTLDADSAATAAEATAEMDDTGDTTDTTDTTTEDVSPLVQAVQNADPEHGETLFAMIEGGSPCSTCHYVDSTDSLVGPGMLGLADTAAERVAGQSAEEYLYNSIVHPNEYVVDGYPEMVMPQNYEDLLSEQDLYDLVAYMLTLTAD